MQFNPMTNILKPSRQKAGWSRELLTAKGHKGQEGFTFGQVDELDLPRVSGGYKAKASHVDSTCTVSPLSTHRICISANLGCLSAAGLPNNPQDPKEAEDPGGAECSNRSHPRDQAET